MAEQELPSAQLPPELYDAQNTRYDNYWLALPEIAGSGIERLATANHTRLARLEKAFMDQVGVHDVTRAEAQTAWEWYRKLGTFNSLAGGRSTLLRAAATVYFEGDAADPEDTVAFFDALTDNSKAPDTDKTIRSCQIVLDALRDPMPVVSMAYQTIKSVIA